MKRSIVIIAALCLSACAGTAPQLDSPAPIVDKAVMSQEQFAMFSKNEQDCRQIQQTAMPSNLFEALSAPDVHQYEKDREAKAGTIMRNCLQQRGHNVIY